MLLNTRTKQQISKTSVSEDHRTWGNLSRFVFSYNLMSIHSWISGVAAFCRRKVETQLPFITQHEMGLICRTDVPEAMGKAVNVQIFTKGHELAQKPIPWVLWEHNCGVSLKTEYSSRVPQQSCRPSPGTLPSPPHGFLVSHLNLGRKMRRGRLRNQRPKFRCKWEARPPWSKPTRRNPRWRNTSIKTWYSGQNKVQRRM